MRTTVSLNAVYTISYDQHTNKFDLHYNNYSKYSDGWEHIASFKAFANAEAAMRCLVNSGGFDYDREGGRL